MKVIDYSNGPAFRKKLRSFCHLAASAAGDVSATVSGILADVRQRGDVAVREYTELN
jgi:histidinol dehydrogenase